jgi:hypothetical protein
MKLTLIRRWFAPNYTIGKLFIDDVVFSDTLEDVNRDFNHDGDLLDEGEAKVYAETAIPFGTYKVIVNHSPKFGRDMVRLLDVPHFEGILIHRGSTERSTAGCIIVGENNEKGRISNSIKYELELIEKVRDAQDRGEKIVIEIL